MNGFKYSSIAALLILAGCGSRGITEEEATVAASWVLEQQLLQTLPQRNLNPVAQIEYRKFAKMSANSIKATDCSTGWSGEAVCAVSGRLYDIRGGYQLFEKKLRFTPSGDSWSVRADSAPGR